MPAFSGTLNRNEIQNAIFNMIISQQTFADNINGVNDALVSKARVDGGLFGDTKLYYATDALKSYAWGNDSEAANLLALHRPPAPSCQAIVLNVFRQIALTTDNYLSKRAFSTEGAFADYTSVMMQWLTDTKRIYEATLYNVFIGTGKGTATGSSRSIDVTTAVGSATGEEYNRLKVEAIAEGIANLITDLGDLSRSFNDYAYLRSYSKDMIQIVWNANYVNQIRKVDLPTIFHKDGLIDKFEENILPARFFGTIGTTTLASATGTQRTMVEADFTVSSVTTHCFPGDVIPTGASAAAYTYYVPDATIICKVLVKLPPMMSAFSVGTSFWNPRSLTETHYLTFGHNTLEHLKNYPFIEVKEI